MGKFDLRKRTYIFSVELVKLLNKISKSGIFSPLLNQLIRSGTSIGANVEEADSSPSRKDFKYKLTISKKEAAETVYWMNILIDTNIFQNNENLLSMKNLLNECEQILRILSAIIRKL